MEEEHNAEVALHRLSPEEKASVDRVKNRKRGRQGKDMPAIIRAAAKALKQSGMTNAEIGQQLNFSEDKIQRLLQGTAAVNPEDLERVKSEFAGEIASIVTKLLTKANTSEFIDKIAGKNLVVSLAVLIDKLNLLTGKPTAITETKNVIEQAAGQLRQLEDLEASLKQSLHLPTSPKEN